MEEMPGSAVVDDVGSMDRVLGVGIVETRGCSAFFATGVPSPTPFKTRMSCASLYRLPSIRQSALAS